MKVVLAPYGRFATKPPLDQGRKVPNTRVLHHWHADQAIEHLLYGFLGFVGNDGCPMPHGSCRFTRGDS